MEWTQSVPITLSSGLYFAACPGGEGAVLKTVGCERLARSNRVCSVLNLSHKFTILDGLNTAVT